MMKPRHFSADIVVSAEPPLFVPDRDLRGRLAPHMGWETFKAALKDAESRGFPSVSAFWKGRYWPAVKAWPDRELRPKDIIGERLCTMDGAAVVPFGAEPGTHAWLHSECWRPWHETRREQARAALSQIGIRPSGRSTVSDDRYGRTV
jgi:hypothetical protein